MTLMTTVKLPGGYLIVREPSDEDNDGAHRDREDSRGPTEPDAKRQHDQERANDAFDPTMIRERQQLGGAKWEIGDQRQEGVDPRQGIGNHRHSAGESDQGG